MFGLNCSKCNRPLTYPFKSTVFSDDGEVVELKNRLPKISDEHKSVVVYMHGNCRKQGKYSARMLRLKARDEASARAAQVREKYLSGKRSSLGVKVRLVGMGFHVTLWGDKIVKVLPVKRL